MFIHIDMILLMEQEISWKEQELKGDLYLFKFNSDSQQVTSLGETLSHVPSSLKLMYRRVKYVSLGFDHTLIVFENFEELVYSQGIGKQGELGLGSGVTKAEGLTLLNHKFEGKVKYI